MTITRGTSRQYLVALRAMIVLTVITGLAYPLLITGVGQVALPAQANGSLVTVDGRVAGSTLIGQSFTDADGTALPEWFQSRPSAAGDGYDAGASSGSNLGPTNEALLDTVDERRAEIAARDDVAPADVPADAVTASGSGLDPHISPEYALLQVPRIAAERGLDDAEVSGLVESMIHGRDLGYLGEPTVTVLSLNIALAELDADSAN